MIKKYSLFVVIAVSIFTFKAHKGEDGKLAPKVLINSKYSRTPASIKVNQSFEKTQNDLNLLKKELKEGEKEKSSYVDPYEFEHLKSLEISKRLDVFYNHILENNIIDESVSEIALKYIKTDNGYIKKAALMLLSTQPPSEKNLDAIIDNVIYYHDGYLVDTALLEFEKYKNDQVALDRIHQSFLKNLKTGSLAIRKRIAKGLINFRIAHYKYDYLQLLSEKKFLPSIRRMILNAVNRG